jgi:hypothetical protein
LFDSNLIGFLGGSAKKLLKLLVLLLSRVS